MSQSLKLHLIDSYRQTIDHRYRFENIQQHDPLPAFFTQEKANELRNFFLENLYPDSKKREELDAAFSRLESYVSEPAKVWGILGSLTTAIFRFGIQFPKALKVGIETLQTHTTARNFEQMLLEAALKRNLQPPVSEEQLLQCIADLPKEKIHRFIEELSNLFLLITDTSLLRKTIGILEDVAQRMKNQPKTYDDTDINAIMLGINILKKGCELMEKYSDEEKQVIVDFIAQNEYKFIETIYGAYKKKNKKNV
jgi:hypothetical protein